MSKHELIALIRRIDLDGDAKVSYEEFYEGVKSQFAQSHKIGKTVKSKGVLSSSNGNTSFMVKSSSKKEILPHSENDRSTTPLRKMKKLCTKRP